MDLTEYQKRLDQFAQDRDWDQFHTPKNLAMALAGEAGELLEIFQWLTAEQSADLSDEDVARVKEELADIMIYILDIAYKLDVDIEGAVDEKLKLNEEKYPIELSKGNAIKYNRR